MRLAALERALQDQTAIVADLERELHRVRERSKRQARLIGERTALAFLPQYGTLERAAPRMLEAFGQELEWQVVHLLMLDPATQTMGCRLQWCSGQLERATAVAGHTFASGVGLPGHVWSSAKPAWVTDIAGATNFPDGEAAEAAGLHAACAFPIIVDGEVHAIIEMFASDVRELDEDLLVALGALGGKIGQWIEQSRTHDQLRFNELQIARHIQTAILPRDLVVEGLEVAATMVPATEVGGDYYDVLPFAGGAWFGIGDVTGHGVGAGMIMVMVQSAVAALTKDPKRVSPRDVVAALNTLLYDNIRRRLREDDHVTFSLLRYTSDGVVRFSGAHEDILIWRAKDSRIEVVETSGVWLGAVPLVNELTRDDRLQLAPGDILVLYSDGLTEAMDASREQFGLKRLCAAVRELADTRQSISQICDALIARVLRWCSTQNDDISLLMARYHGLEIDYDIDGDHTVVQMGDAAAAR